MKRLVAALVFAAGTAFAQTPAVSAAFDGTWLVSVDCPTARDGAMGYNYDLEARIENGVLKGERLNEGEVGWLRIEGRVRGDGSISLYARGLTGNPSTSVGRVPPRTPFSYRAHGRLEGNQGNARRDDATRICDLTLIRR